MAAVTAAILVKSVIIQSVSDRDDRDTPADCSAVPGWQPVQLQGAQHPAVFSPRSCRIWGGKEAAVPAFGAREDGAGICRWSV